MRETQIGKTRLVLEGGSVVNQDVDVIVNAANEGLWPGGGVSGAIHEAAGPSVAEECARIGHVPTGRAAITGGGRLAARFVIHAVGPVWRGGTDGEPELLASAYRCSLELADAHALRSIAFPSIGTGIFGYPRDRAAPLALETVVRYLRGATGLKVVKFVFYGPHEIEPFERALEEIVGRRG
ncbi:MAG: macro domain-containing protein [Chloroflexota bacterium]